MNSSGSQPWPEAATVVVACLLGVLAAFMALLVLLDEGAPNPPRSVKVETVVVTENVHPDNQLNV